MKKYLVIGENADVGEEVLFSGSKSECIKWIWNNCDVGDLRNIHNGRIWGGVAYYDTNNIVYEIWVDKFYQ